MLWDNATFEPMMTVDEQKLENDRLFEQEFLPHADALYTFAYHLVYNDEDARDLVQDTFFKSYRFISSYEKGTNAKAWLFKILKNSFINNYRRKTRQPLQTDYEDVLTYAAELMGVEPPPEIPFEKAVMSEMARSFYADNKRVSNRLIREELGVKFLYPTYREGLQALAMRGEGKAF